MVPIGLLALLCALVGCDGKKSKQSDGPTGAEIAATTQPVALPHYEIPAELQTKYPEVVRFVRRFLETCLANDYAGYRSMVGVRFPPEPRDRFEKMYEAIRSVAVLSIDPIELGGLPEPTYRVVSEIRMDPKHPIGMRHSERQIAILVFPEGDEASGDPWRMVQAPPRLQPKLKSRQPQPTSAPASQPSTPDYPWDASGDD